MQIDKFGKFPYVLVKLSDRMAGNKLIVRGKNGRSEPQLVSGVSKEVHCAPRAGSTDAAPPRWTCCAVYLASASPKNLIWEVLCLYPAHCLQWASSDNCRHETQRFVKPPS